MPDHAKGSSCPPHPLRPLHFHMRGWEEEVVEFTKKGDSGSSPSDTQQVPDSLVKGPIYWLLLRSTLPPLRSGSEDGERHKSTIFVGRRAMKTSKIWKYPSFWLLINQMGFGNPVQSLSSRDDSSSLVVKYKKLSDSALYTSLSKGRENLPVLISKYYLPSTHTGYCTVFHTKWWTRMGLHGWMQLFLCGSVPWSISTSGGLSPKILVTVTA